MPKWRRPLVHLPLVLAAVLLGGIIAFSPPATRRIILNSAWLALSAAAIALPLGTFLALLLMRFAVGGRRLAAACLVLLLFLPLVVQVSGWDAALGKLGWYTLALGSGGRPWLSGMTAAIFLHGIAAVPWVALIMCVGLSQVDSRQEEAAHLETSPQGVLLGVTLPHCASFLTAAGLWVAVATANDMTVTNIYLNDPRQMTYTEQFYMNYSAAADARPAVLAVLPGLAAFVVVILAALWLVTRLSACRVLVGAVAFHTPAVDGRCWLSTLALWLPLGLLVLVPLASLVSKAGFVVEEHGAGRVRSWSMVKCASEIARIPAHFDQEIEYTMLTAIGAATLASVVAIALAWPARRGGWRAIGATTATILALATPGPVVAVGLIYLLNHRIPPYLPLGEGRSESWLILLYDKTLVVPTLAQAIHALPLTIVVYQYSFATLADDELAAAQLDGAGPFRSLWLIALPQRWLAIAGAWLAALAVAAGDLAWSNLVIPPGGDTVQRRIFGLVHAGVEEQVAALCLVATVAYAVLALAIVWLMDARPVAAAGRR